MTTRRCVLKKVSKKGKKYVHKKSSSKKLQCSNEEDPITFSNFKTDNISADDIIALPQNNGKMICFENETLWSMFANHVNYSYDIFVRVSNNDFTDISPINMAVWGIQDNLLNIEKARLFIRKRSQDGLRNKEFRNPNDPYEANESRPESLLENF